MISKRSVWALALIAMLIPSCTGGGRNNGGFTLTVGWHVALRTEAASDGTEFEVDLADWLKPVAEGDDDGLAEGD